MWSIDGYDGCGEVYSSKEGGFCFIITCCNGSVLLDFLEEVFDEVPPFVGLLIVFALFFSVRFWRDDRFDASFFEQIQHTLQRIIGLVC